MREIVRGVEKVWVIVWALRNDVELVKLVGIGGSACGNTLGVIG